MKTRMHSREMLLVLAYHRDRKHTEMSAKQ